jgi:hypothetical protein
MDNPLLSKIETSKSLPTLPHILLQLIDICNREDKGIRDLIKIINQDPSISERLSVDQRAIAAPGQFRLLQPETEDYLDRSGLAPAGHGSGEKHSHQLFGVSGLSPAEQEIHLQPQAVLVALLELRRGSPQIGAQNEVPEPG